MPFPTTSILDNFNRSNGAIGSNWTTSGFSAYPLVISSDEAAATEGANLDGGVWNASFGPILEAYVDIPVLPTTTGFGLFLRGNSTATTCYSLLYALGSPNAIGLYYFSGGSFVGQAGSSINVTFAAGDTLGARMVGNVLTLFRKTGGVWSVLGTITDTSNYISGAGYIGCYTYNDTTVRLDNFGGGTVPGGTTTVYPNSAFSYSSGYAPPTGNIASITLPNGYVSGPLPWVVYMHWYNPAVDGITCADVLLIQQMATIYGVAVVAFNTPNYYPWMYTDLYGCDYLSQGIAWAVATVPGMASYKPCLYGVSWGSCGALNAWVNRPNTYSCFGLSAMIPNLIGMITDGSIANPNAVGTPTGNWCSTVMGGTYPGTTAVNNRWIEWTASNTFSGKTAAQLGNKLLMEVHGDSNDTISIYSDQVTAFFGVLPSGNLYSQTEVTGAGHLDFLTDTAYGATYAPLYFAFFLANSQVSNNTWNVSCSDGLAGAETVSTKCSFGCSCMDGIAGTDAPGSACAFKVTGADGLALSELVSAISAFQAAITDSAALSDAASGPVAFAGGVTEGLSTSDAASVACAFSTASQDDVLFSDSVSAAVQFLVAVPDGLSLSDLVANGNIYALSATDSLNAVDAASGQAALAGSVTEGLSLAEAILAACVFAVGIPDGLSLADYISIGAQIFGLTISDGLALSDSLSAALSAAVSALDALALADSASGSCTFNVQVTDGAQLGEVLSAIMQFAAAITDGFALGDLAVRQSPVGVPIITFTVNGRQFNFIVTGSNFNFTVN